MALKPPPIGEVMQQVNELVSPAGLVEEVDRNARQLAQSALRKLDFVSRDEFDAQAAILARTRSKVAAQWNRSSPRCRRWSPNWRRLNSAESAVSQQGAARASVKNEPPGWQLISLAITLRDELCTMQQY
jgi:BMFP domain-containing protein YqiC